MLTRDCRSPLWVQRHLLVGQNRHVYTDMAVAACTQHKLAKESTANATTCLLFCAGHGAIVRLACQEIWLQPHILQHLECIMQFRSSPCFPWACLPIKLILAALTAHLVTVLPRCASEQQDSCLHTLSVLDKYCEGCLSHEPYNCCITLGSRHLTVCPSTV